MVKSRKGKLALEPGSVYAVKLNDGAFAFGVLCSGNEVTFLGFKSESSAVPATLLGEAIAFRIPVAKDVLEDGGWPIVGNVELPESYRKPGRYLHKPIGFTQCFVYSDGKSVPAKAEDELFGLEVLSTWFAFHVEERLESFFIGKKSKFDVAIRKQLGLPVDPV